MDKFRPPACGRGWGWASEYIRIHSLRRSRRNGGTTPLVRNAVVAPSTANRQLEGFKLSRHSGQTLLSDFLCREQCPVDRGRRRSAGRNTRFLRRVTADLENEGYSANHLTSGTSERPRKHRGRTRSAVSAEPLRMGTIRSSSTHAGGEELRKQRMRVGDDPVPRLARRTARSNHPVRRHRAIGEADPRGPRVEGVLSVPQ